MPELVVYRGLPASGKTTLAKAWVADSPLERARVNRDDLRAMLHGGVFLGKEGERRQVVLVRDRLVDGLLRSGVSVASDDTNLPNEVCRQLARIGAAAGATVRYVDLTHVPLEECLVRDALRGAEGSVGADVIRRMHLRFVKGRPTPLPVPAVETPPPPPAPYAAREGTPRAVMVDLDGTLCLHNGRSPYDESRVGDDLPNGPVLDAVHALAYAGYRIVFCSGRSEGCRPATEAWLDAHVGATGPLFMRAAGDTRKDAVVKRELFDAHIRDHYDVRFVLDDRQRVVDGWRELGLAVFQVAPGQF